MKLNNFQEENKIAIEFINISKVYKLYPSLGLQVMDLFGLSNLFFWKKRKYSAFKAIDNISLSIRRGERVGIIGRNGSGKTTLLKLTIGNFTPSSGKICVNGTIQALMQVGLGFHPEFSGYENIKSALIYNGLAGNDLNEALNDIINFSELENFLHQPIKTYSLGMQSRLQFATATAIKPDILIVDEILGAGDAYFSGKSSARMEKLAYSGTTFLLVSHSIQQILQFCQRVIWIEDGRVVMDGEALEVVRKYEEFIHHLMYEAQKRNQIMENDGYKSTMPQWMREKILQEVFSDKPSMGDFSYKGSVSRWPVENGLKIIDVKIIDHTGTPSSLVYTHKPLEIELKFIAEESRVFHYIACIVLFTKDGRYLCRHCSEPYMISLRKDETSSITLIYRELKLGNGEYVFSASLYKELDLHNLNAAKPYDLLSRSFAITVKDKVVNDSTIFHHPAIWVAEEVKT